MSGQVGQPSRLTFRDKVDVCWQKQLRDKFNAEGVPPVPHLDLKRAVVRPVSRKTAEQIIVKYEWLGTLPSECSKFYGLFYGAFCAGVTCISVGVSGAGIHAHKKFGVRAGELACLARGANVHWSPTGSNSKLVSLSCRLLAKDSDAKIIIAYSDSDAGEIGTIYQACNWIYIGVGSKMDQWVSPKGILRNLKYPYNIAERRGGTFRIWSDRLIENGWKKQKTNPKHRYVYILDKTDGALIERVESMRQPYPKRGTGETDNAPDSNRETGGASPTVPLLETT